MSTLETVSGRQVDVLTPNPKDISIEDIAWHLSRLPRFCGATIPYIPYTVAQHSVQVMKEIGQMCDNVVNVEYPEELMINRSKMNKNRMMLHGLLHDAAEAYIGDIPSPIKHISGFKEAIDEVESRLLKCVYESIGVVYPTEMEHSYIHYADMVQRAIEAHNFMYSRGKDWGMPEVSFMKLQSFEAPLTSTQAYDIFLYEFKYLMDGKK